METFAPIADDEAAPEAIPAATIVVFRRSKSGGAAELLFVERSSAMSFAAGAVVFPGGRVDPEDHALAAAIAGELDADDAAARIAAIRETLEETGLALGIAQPVTGEQAYAARAMLLETGTLSSVLAHFGWQLALDQLVPFARWVPRQRLTRTFDARFYLYDIGTGAVDVTVDDTENRHLFWSSAEDVLRRADAGELHVIFPTRRNLERLAAYPTFAQCKAHAEATPIVTITPEIVDRNGVPWLVLPPESGYPIDGEPVALAHRS